jgi:hypothetical protein
MLMRLLTLAAGVAVGYVLGTRAGREKYNQIVTEAKAVKANPSLDQVQRSVRQLASEPAPAVTGTAVSTTAASTAGAPTPATAVKPQARARTPRTTTATTVNP